MRVGCFFLTLLLAGSVSAQFIEASFPAPSSNISGIDYGYFGDVLVLDSLENLVYSVDAWTGAVQYQIPLPVFSNPLRALASYPSADSSLLVVESGTALLHQISYDGTLMNTWNFADSGLISITGISICYNDEIYLLDPSDRSIYTTDLPLGSEYLFHCITIADEIDVYDTGGVSWGYPVSCSDPISPVRFYLSEGSYEPLGYGEYESALAVGSCYGARIYFNDPQMGLIHRYCPHMGGISGEHSASTPPIISVRSNPAADGTVVHFSEVPESGGSLILIDVSGRIVKVIEISSGCEQTSLSGLQPGVYSCVFESDDFMEMVHVTITE